MKTFQHKGNVKVKNRHFVFSYLLVSSVQHFKNVFSVLNKLFG